jgi:hypothetical protein
MNEGDSPKVLFLAQPCDPAYAIDLTEPAEGKPEMNQIVVTDRRRGLKRQALPRIVQNATTEFLLDLDEGEFRRSLAGM